MIIYNSASLVLKDQLIVIKQAKKQLIQNKADDLTVGLCWILARILTHEFNIVTTAPTLKNLIPLFTKENALKYGNAEGKHGYWWWSTDCYKFDFKNRMLFLDWMEKLIEDTIKKDLL